MRHCRKNRLAVGRHRASPAWRPASRVRHGVLSRELSRWLFDSASLSRRLSQAAGGDFRVRLLGQCWGRPDWDERAALGMADRETALIRQVQLLCEGRVVVYARTVLPRSTLTGGCRSLSRLGGRSLGERLFRDKSMRRGEVDVAPLAAPQSLYHRAADQGQSGVWGRRSVFSLQGRCLLVSEVFIPPLLKCGGQFRVMRKR